MQVDKLNQRPIIITSIEDDKHRRNHPGFAIVELFKQFQHLLQFRELIRNLVIRDLKVRYKNSFLGILWSLMNPLLMMTVFTAVFTNLTTVF